MSTLVLTPSTSSNPAAVRPTRRRRAREAVELVVRSGASLVNIPVLQESARVTQELVAALQAPGRNDATAQGQIDRIDGVIACVESFAEKMSSMVHDIDGEGAGCLVSLQSLIDDLTRIKAELEKVKNEKYAAKLAYQKNIDQLLAEKYQEFLERTCNFYLDGAMRANHTAIRTSRLEERIETLDTLLAESTARPVAVQNLFF